VEVADHPHTAALAPAVPRPAQLAHTARAFDQIAGRRVRRQVVDDGSLVGVCQQPCGCAQVLLLFGESQQHQSEV
jgi:hypothetical protein